MRIISSFLVFSAVKLVFASEHQDEPINNEPSSNASVQSPRSLAQRRSAFTSRSNSPLVEGANIPADNEFPTHSFNEYETRGVDRVAFMENPLQGSRSRASPSVSEPRNTESPSSAAALLFMPVDKPVPDLDDDNDSSENETEPVDEVGIENLLSMIPDRFTVTENSGTYGIDTSDAYLTSADVMNKRSALYQVLAEIYTFFDMFDFDGFLDFLRKGKTALTHRDLRYHLIENIVQRSLKTKNEGTLESLARFIVIIDSNSVGRTVSQAEIENFKDFAKKMEKSKNIKILSEPIKSALINYLENEKTRIDPLKESLRSADYTTATRIIESSDGLIFISPNNFFTILDLPCSSARYNFISWAISEDHFNPAERYDNELMTPLMFAAKWPARSNDIVKAILLNAPGTKNLENSKNLTALDFAKKNDILPKIYRKPMIEMLELEDPSLDAINEILNKHIPKSK